MGTSNNHKEAMTLWAKAHSLKYQIEYNKSPKLCKFCDTVIPYEKRNTNKFCNQSCSASYNNVRKERKYPLTKCKSCDNEFRPKRGNDGEGSTEITNPIQGIKIPTRIRHHHT